MQQIRQKHDRRSYLSVGIGGDSQSLLEREPTRSKDRGLLSYNNIIVMDHTSNHVHSNHFDVFSMYLYPVCSKKHNKQISHDLRHFFY